MKVLLKILKVILIGSYALVAGEMFLRLFSPVPMLPRYVCSMPYGIRGNVPNQAYWHTSSEYEVCIKINSKGVRADREIPYHKDNGVKRIVVIGDSFGLGYEVSYDQMFTTQMEKYLNEKGIRCEVVNMSVSGHGSSENLIMLENEGWKYEPDLVLMAWHGSDYTDNVRANLYGLENGRLVQRSKTYLPGMKVREFLFRITPYRWVADNSQLYNLVREKVALTVKDILEIAMNVIEKNKLEEKQTSETSRLAQVEDYPKALVLAMIREIRDRCKVHHAEFVIFNIPFCRSRTEYVSTFPLTTEDAQKEFGFYCPISDFDSYKGQMLYWEKSQGHFTPLGCSIVGQGIAKYIMEHHLLNQY